MTEKKDIFRPQSEFPLINEYKKIFAVDDRTIFAYDNKIYSNYELSHDLIVHEYTHHRQQAEYGLEWWVKNYLNNPEFRLKMELEAYKAQLDSIKDREIRNKVRIRSAVDLSSSLYNDIIKPEVALRLLK
jgi:hypothetical protein